MSLVGVELENGGVLIKFVPTGAETGGALHVQEARYPPRLARPSPLVQRIVFGCLAPFGRAALRR